MTRKHLSVRADYGSAPLPAQRKLSRCGVSWDGAAESCYEAAEAGVTTVSRCWVDGSAPETRLTSKQPVVQAQTMVKLMNP